MECICGWVTIGAFKCLSPERTQACCFSFISRGWRLLVSPWLIGLVGVSPKHVDIFCQNQYVHMTVWDDSYVFLKIDMFTTEVVLEIQNKLWLPKDLQQKALPSWFSWELYALRQPAWPNFTSANLTCLGLATKNAAEFDWFLMNSTGWVSFHNMTILSRWSPGFAGLQKGSASKYLEQAHVHI